MRRGLGHAPPEAVERLQDLGVCGRGGAGGGAEGGEGRRRGRRGRGALERKGGEPPAPPPPGRPAYAQPLSPPRQAPASMAFVTDSNRPQPLWQPPPTACLTASGAASEAPSLPLRPLGGGGERGYGRISLSVSPTATPVGDLEADLHRGGGCRTDAMEQKRAIETAEMIANRREGASRAGGRGGGGSKPHPPPRVFHVGSAPPPPPPRGP